MEIRLKPISLKVVPGIGNIILKMTLCGETYVLLILESSCRVIFLCSTRVIFSEFGR